MESQFRYKEVDFLRGLVVVIMALDHVRDFYSPHLFQPENLERTYPALFFTRWITHFCAPLFILLAGMSAAFYQEKDRSKSELARYLLIRGVLLIAIELVWINLWWRLGVMNWVFVQVIWAIGWSMIVLAGLIYLPKKLILFIGAAMILGHNLLDSIQPENMSTFGWLWTILHTNAWIAIGNNGGGIYVTYPLIPWIGVMALGYVLARYILEYPRYFGRICISAGLAISSLFFALRYFNFYGDPQIWSFQGGQVLSNIMSFLNTTKYPASLLFLNMTLGPSLILLGYLHTKQLDSGISRSFILFGSVPLFFYLIHIPVITISAYVWSLASFEEVKVSWQLIGPSDWPTGYEPSLTLTYMVWIILLVFLYYCCRWYKDFKSSRRRKLLKYI